MSKSFLLLIPFLFFAGCTGGSPASGGWSSSTEIPDNQNSNTDEEDTDVTTTTITLPSVTTTLPIATTTTLKPVTSTTTTTLPKPPATTTTTTTTTLPKPPVAMCSKLDFSRHKWSTSFSYLDQQAFMIAMNLSGSFEGPDGWRNLTNDFDGMGLSQGLLNQTLGTGSLQPLWVKMRDRNLSAMTDVFSKERLESVLAMLKKWQSSSLSAASWVEESDPTTSVLLSPLDEPLFHGELRMMLATAEQGSVDWARQNLYTGTKFKTDWANEIRNLGSSGPYVSLQIEAAMSLHTKARGYQKRIGINDFRSYLLFFDINVQNGGLYSEDWTEYESWAAKNPSATSRAKLIRLLELRLRHVKSAYVEDVRARKTAIIDGTGVVHGSLRKFETQYCFDRLLAYPQK